MLRMLTDAGALYHSSLLGRLIYCYAVVRGRYICVFFILFVLYTFFYFF
jgi:hypothetical protein